jgi:hypothetical protein
MLLAQNTVRQQPEKSIDPEELRYNQTNSVVWSSEGARVITKTFLYCSILQFKQPL